MRHGDTPDLERFVHAQDRGATYAHALAELRAGRKRTHWMWFVFPQVAGLGSSPTARLYALDDAAEAREYLDHPLLGARLRECARALLELPGNDPVAVLGEVDALKLRSSMTLFLRAAPHEQLLRDVLAKYFDGRPDPRTDGLI